MTVSPSTVTVAPGGSATVTVTLSAPAAEAGTSEGGGFQFAEFSGDVVFTSAADTLRVPYLLVPRATSGVSAQGDLKVTKKKQPVDGTVTAALRGKAGAFDVNADFYTWGLEDKRDVSKAFTDTGYDLRAAGVQSFDYGTDHLLVFAVNTHQRWSNAATNEFDVLIDTNRDGEPDWAVVVTDGGVVTSGSADGVPTAFAFSLTGPDAFALDLAPMAPTDSSTVLIPVWAGAELGITAQSPTFDYTVQSFTLLDDASFDGFDGMATYNPWARALENGQYVTVPVGGGVDVPVGVDAAAFTAQKPLGVMAVVLDNPAGAGEAILVKAK
ncbi:hypothetical protein MRBLWH3_001481 [Microbacterium sp. LWH3-1.2]